MPYFLIVLLKKPQQKQTNNINRGIVTSACNRRTLSLKCWTHGFEFMQIPGCHFWKHGRQTGHQVKHKPFLTLCDVLSYKSFIIYNNKIQKPSAENAKIKNSRINDYNNFVGYKFIFQRLFRDTSDVKYIFHK